MTPACTTDFDDWLVETFTRVGSFTMLIVLVEIGAAFFQGDRVGLIDDATARQRLLSLTRHLEKDRSILTHSEFFNTEGLRMKIEEIGTH